MQVSTGVLSDPIGPQRGTGASLILIICIFFTYMICISNLQKSYFCELWLALWPSRNTADSERLALEEVDKPLSSAKPSVRKELGQPTFQQGYKWEREVQIQIQIQLQIREIDKPLSSFHQPNGLSAKKLVSPFFDEDTNGKDNGKRIWTCHNTGCKQHKSNCLFKEKWTVIFLLP